jgi:hypothetical protein
VPPAVAEGDRATYWFFFFASSWRS